MERFQNIDVGNIKVSKFRKSSGFRIVHFFTKVIHVFVELILV